MAKALRTMLAAGIMLCLMFMDYLIKFIKQLL
jgi:hypothetical protein